MKKSKIFRGIMIALAVILAALLIIAAVLFFPLRGKKNTEIWSADNEFRISELQTVEKEREDFKILMFTDT